MLFNESNYRSGSWKKYRNAFRECNETDGFTGKKRRCGRFFKNNFQVRFSLEPNCRFMSDRGSGGIWRGDGAGAIYTYQLDFILESPKKFIRTRRHPLGAKKCL